MSEPQETIVRLRGKLSGIGGLRGVIQRAPGGEYTPYYEGEYEIVPSQSEQTLETASKKMHDDVVVHEIPYYETTNPSGGYTVIIGG